MAALLPPRLDLDRLLVGEQEQERRPAVVYLRTMMILLWSYCMSQRETRMWFGCLLGERWQPRQSPLLSSPIFLSALCSGVTYYPFRAGGWRALLLCGLLPRTLLALLTTALVSSLVIIHCPLILTCFS